MGLKRGGSSGPSRLRAPHPIRRKPRLIWSKDIRIIGDGKNPKGDAVCVRRELLPLLTPAATAGELKEYIGKMEIKPGWVRTGYVKSSWRREPTTMEESDFELKAGDYIMRVEAFKPYGDLFSGVPPEESRGHGLGLSGMKFFIRKARKEKRRLIREGKSEKNVAISFYTFSEGMRKIARRYGFRKIGKGGKGQGQDFCLKL